MESAALCLYPALLSLSHPGRAENWGFGQNDLVLTPGGSALRRFFIVGGVGAETAILR